MTKQRATVEARFFVAKHAPQNDNFSKWLLYNRGMHSYTVSLRIESAELDTSRVTEELGITPWQTRFAGQYRSPKSVWEKALWEFDVQPEQSDVATENWPHWPQWKSLEKAFEKTALNFHSLCEMHSKLQARSRRLHLGRAFFVEL